MKPMYRSPQSEVRFRSAYAVLLGTWDIEYQSVWIKTDFGETHVLTCGSANAAAVVLVPGAQGTAAMWGLVARALAGERNVFCIDLIDQVGDSRATRVLSSPQDSDLWLAQTLDGLGLQRIDLVGNSLGAFIAGKFSSANAERVRSLVMTAPAATVSAVSSAYIIQVLLAMGLPGKWAKTQFLRSASAGVLNETDPLFQVLQSAMVESRVISKLLPRPLTEEELASLTMPVLLLLGERDNVNAEKNDEVCHNMDEKLDRLRCEVIEGAGHLWAPAHFARASEIIVSFLKGIS